MICFVRVFVRSFVRSFVPVRSLVRSFNPTIPFARLSVRPFARSFVRPSVGHASTAGRESRRSRQVEQMYQRRVPRGYMSSRPTHTNENENRKAGRKEVFRRGLLPCAQERASARECLSTILARFFRFYATAAATATAAAVILAIINTRYRVLHRASPAIQ